MTDLPKDPAPKRRANIDVPAGTPVSQCRDATCQAPIYWTVLPKSGKRTPVDCREEYGGVAPTALEHGRGVSHFATCPGAATFRKRGR